MDESQRRESLSMCRMYTVMHSGSEIHGQEGNTKRRPRTRVKRLTLRMKERFFSIDELPQIEKTSQEMSDMENLFSLSLSSFLGNIPTGQEKAITFQSRLWLSWLPWMSWMSRSIYPFEWRSKGESAFYLSLLFLCSFLWILLLQLFNPSTWGQLNCSFFSCRYLFPFIRLFLLVFFLSLTLDCWPDLDTSASISNFFSMICSLLTSTAFMNYCLGMLIDC